MIRLRQVALVARDLDPVVADLAAVFGLKVAYRDPAVATYGLVNAVLPFGGEFIEIVQPVTPDASAARYLERRGGDAGYMLIFQVPDALRHRVRLEEQGIRTIAKLDRPDYTFTHFHPADFNGVLTSIDTQDDGRSWRDRLGPWTPAGPDWQASMAEPGIAGIMGARIQADDPAAVAQRWAGLLESETIPGHPAAIRLDNGTIEFTEASGRAGTGFTALDLAVVDPDLYVGRAESFGIETAECAVTIGGVAMRLHHV
ncbi:MAG: VOC family protein [Parvibaculaceae bacterium]|nr:VOC family protein [Parvibaculaceae bacterium]